jgi:cytochrome c-type biogenesis protein CcmE
MKKTKNKTMLCQLMMSKIIAAILIFAALFTQTACNESGGGGLLAGGGIGGTGISIGEISGFGSVIVNDVDFDTKKAKVFINGRKVGKGDSDVRNKLGLGMVVRVEGKFLGTETGKADRIVFNENVKGPVTAVEILDTRIKKITVLGQIVIIDEDTNLVGSDDTGDILKKGNVLQISGWTDGYGVIQATYVALADPDADVVAKGIITKVNDNDWQSYFFINRLRVDFSQAELKGFSGNELPAQGQLIAVTGRLDTNGILVAEEVRLENDVKVEDAEDVEIEGIVSHFSPPSNFDLGTTPVITDYATVYKGIAPEDIFSGLRLLIKGSLTEGRLLADEVIAKDKINLEGTVESVDYDLGEISLRGLTPLVIHVNDVTKIFGNAADLDNIEIGRHVKILGYVAGQKKVEAAQVKVEKKDNDSAKVKLQGPLTDTDISAEIISIFKIEVDTNEIPDDGFKAAQEGWVSRKDFFNLVVRGDTISTVSANGNLIGDVVEWKEIELLQE